MPQILPFVALRYSSGAGDPADLIAPPYDVIDSAQAAELRDRSPYNAVRLILPEGVDPARYAAASSLLDTWVREGVLTLDEVPAVYVYRQRYALAGQVTERLALFGALELEPPGSGVLPHERTHSGPRADRLALTLATRTQLSPVFLLARDPEGTLLEGLRDLANTPPELEATTPDGIEHAMWPVRDVASVSALCDPAARHPLLIADGHHRYETALEASGRLDGAAARLVLACIVSAVDPGLVIRPTHRTLRSFAAPGSRDVPATDELAVKLEPWFQVQPVGALDPAAAEREAAADPAGMVLVPGSRIDGALRLTPRPIVESETREEGTAGAGGGAVGRIAAVLFDRHVMHDLLGVDADTAAHEGRLEYHRDAAEAVWRAGERGTAFLLPPVSLDAVWEAAAAGVRLPPKSTYFEPKIPSGLLFRPV